MDCPNSATSASMIDLVIDIRDQEPANFSVSYPRIELGVTLYKIDDTPTNNEKKITNEKHF